VPVPGKPFTVRVKVDLPKDFYQDADSPFLTLEADGPFQTLGRSASPPLLRGGKASYHGSFLLERTVVLPGGTPVPPALTLKTGWQICRENGICLLPADGTMKVTFGSGEGTSPGPPSPPWTFWAMLLAAFAGGLFLNLMPCVFPVLALKAVGLAAASTLTLSQRRREALEFAGGGWGVVFLLGLSAALLASLGQRLDWGFSFQQPLFIWTLALVFWVLTLQLWGIGTWTWTPFRLGPARRRPPAWVGGAFLVVTAAPCTAPLLGPALGFALTQDPVVIPVFFASAGLGLVTPLLVLQWVPGWGRWVPKPGRWMVVFERVAGAFLAATVAYLTWVLTEQTGADRVWPALAVLGVSAAGLAWGSRVGGPRWRTWGVNLGVILVTAGSLGPLGQVPATAGSTVRAEGPWQPFTPEVLAAARETDRPVLVDATAAWCATCQVNELAVLDRPDVGRLLDRLDVIRIRADYTRPDPAIHAWLAEVGRVGLPVYALYVPGKPVYLFPELLTDGNFTSALGALVKSP
jgi:thiol:disulfide interchange protein DsbD